MVLLPTLYSLLSTPLMPKVINSLCEILTVSIFRDGKATKALTEPILDWLGNEGLAVVNAAVAGTSTMRSTTSFGRQLEICFFFQRPMRTESRSPR